MSTIDPKLANLPPGTQLTSISPIDTRNFGNIPAAIAGNNRAIAEEEARRDLNKSYEQLLADAHDEIVNFGRTPEQNLGYSNRRLGGISARAAVAAEKSAIESAKAADENIKLQGKVTSLTEKLKDMTFWIMVLTIGMFFFSLVASYPGFKEIYKDIAGTPKPIASAEKSD